jgi:carboxymethylenebutenolidase
MQYMGETITLKAADGHSFAAYTAGPKDAKKGLVVIQEIFGVNHHIRNVVDQWAARGYLAVAPALFDRAEPGIETGYDADDRKRGMEARGKVPEAGAIADIEAAAKWLGDRPKGIIGFCWGGSLVWLTATRTNAVKAASAWYGGGITATKDEKAKVPVQMHFGEKDGSIPMTDVEAIKKAQPGAEVYVYEGAGHGFNCDERDSYNAGAQKTATDRTMAFFDKNLA